MPSPIAHLTVGYLAYRISLRNVTQPSRVDRKLFLITAAFSLLPDIDSAIGLLSGNFGRFHNNLTHSLFVATAVSLAFAGIMTSRRGHFWFWFVVSAACYSMHVLMDAATWGRGVMAFWPITDRRYLLPVTLFYGLHWSDGWFSIRHVWTALTELGFATLLGLLSLGLSAIRPRGV